MGDRPQPGVIFTTFTRWMQCGITCSQGVGRNCIGCFTPIMFHNDVRVKLHSNWLSFRDHVCTIITLPVVIYSGPKKYLDTLKMNLIALDTKIGKLVEYQVVYAKRTMSNLFLELNSLFQSRCMKFRSTCERTTFVIVFNSFSSVFVTAWHLNISFTTKF